MPDPEERSSANKFSGDPLLRHIDLIGSGRIGQDALRLELKRHAIQLLEDYHRIREENAALKKIVDLIELKSERDRLEQRVRELEGK